MHSPYATSYDSGAAAAPSGASAYPAVQPLAHAPQQQAGHQPPQQQHYPGVMPLASDSHTYQNQHLAQGGEPSAPPMHYPPAPAADGYMQPYPQHSSAALVPSQQQQQQTHQIMTPQAYQQGQQQQQQQGHTYQTLTDDLQQMNLQHSVAHGATATAPNTYQQPHQQQQQQHVPAPHGPPQHYPSLPNTYNHQEYQQQQPPLSAQSFPGCQPHTQQQQQSPYPYPYPCPQPKPQQQQTYPQPAAPQLHSSSGNSQCYGSYQTHNSFGASSFNSTAGSTAACHPDTPSSPYPSAQLSTSFGSQHLQQHQGQQQQPEPLPPYPAVPQVLPMMPYNVSPDKVSQGYDVMFYIQNAKNLPAMDWWNGLADPYVIITAHVGGQQFQYRTAHKRNTVNPNYDDEFFQMANLPTGTTFFVEVWDKDMLTDDDVIGRCSWSFCTQEMLPASTAGGGLLNEDSSWGKLVVKLPLKHPSKANKAAGQIELEVCYRPSVRVGKPRMLGPVRFRQHLSPTAGVFTGHWWSNADTMSFSTYKLFLTNISGVFDDVRMPWNKKYDKAVAIFKGPVVMSGIRTQHSALYSTHMGNNRGGVLSTAADFFELFRNGVRDGQRRFFTYVLCEDSLRCSETGAAFFNDMFSKHAMHSNVAEEVLYAGEFCIVPCPHAAGGYKLVIDNNSGTYAPDKDKLSLMQQLFVNNFPDMTVEVLDMKDPRLKEYQLACPSRSGITGAAAAAAAASASAGGAGSNSGSRRGSQAA